MTDFTTDPAAEVAYLKALEKAAQADWPKPPPGPKKPAPLADTANAAKKKTRAAPHSWIAPEVHYRATVYRGLPLVDVARAVLLLGGLIAAALWID
jgi:hypothetical protein